MMIVRQIRRESGNPRIRIRARPTREYGRHHSPITFGSNQIRYECSERYLGYILNIVADADAGHVKPMYSITGRPVPDERSAEFLKGYRDMGPVRIENDAHRQTQHDVYGSAVLAAPHVFFVRRLIQRGDAKRIRDAVYDWAWNPDLGSFTATKDGDVLDASLLRMHEVGFLTADDPRFLGTVRAIEERLRHGDLVFRYSEPDDFGTPQIAFVVCTFWYINALAAIGELEKARELFESVLAHRNPHGLLSEDIDPVSGEPWGNFVQTYSMVGIIDAAARLSVGWDQAS